MMTSSVNNFGFKLGTEDMALKKTWDEIIYKVCLLDLKNQSRWNPSIIPINFIVHG